MKPPPPISKLSKSLLLAYDAAARSQQLAEAEGTPAEVDAAREKATTAWQALEKRIRWLEVRLKGCQRQIRQLSGVIKRVR